MLNIGAGELLVIGLVALIVVGPEQLPSLIRRVGQVVGQVRSVTDGLKKDFMDTVDEAGDLRKTVDPKSWSAGTGTKDDPLVPRGLADKKKTEETAGNSADDTEDVAQTGVTGGVTDDDDSSATGTPIDETIDSGDDAGSDGGSSQQTSALNEDKS